MILILWEILSSFQQWEFWKSFKIWRSYRHEYGDSLFCDTVYDVSMKTNTKFWTVNADINRF